MKVDKTLKVGDVKWVVHEAKLTNELRAYAFPGAQIGARWLGPATVTLALATLLAGLLLGQGVVPGSYDRITDGLVN